MKLIDVPVSNNGARVRSSWMHPQRVHCVFSSHQILYTPGHLFVGCVLVSVSGAMGVLQEGPPGSVGTCPTKFFGGLEDT